MNFKMKRKELKMNLRFMIKSSLVDLREHQHVLKKNQCEIYTCTINVWNNTLTSVKKLRVSKEAKAEGQLPVVVKQLQHQLNTIKAHHNLKINIPLNNLTWCNKSLHQTPSKRSLKVANRVHQQVALALT